MHWSEGRGSDRDVRPIPLAERRGVLYPALVWSGFTAAFVCVVIGNRLQFALGTIDAAIAVLLGNWLLFVYSAAIGFACGRWGLNFQLTLGAVFGRIGALVPGLLLAVLVTGWFAYQLMLTAQIFLGTTGAAGHDAWVILIVSIGIFFAIPVTVGMRHGFAVTATAFPAMFIFAVIATWVYVAPAIPHLLDGPLLGPLPLVTGVAIAFGTFVVSGTMTGDIVRYCRTGNEAVLATAIAFLLSNLPFMLLGVALGAAGKDVLSIMGADNYIALLLFVIAFLSNWASCDACLANASLALKSAFPKVPWTIMSGAAAAAGIAAAAGVLISDLFGWILLLGVLVPPIGGVIVADYYVVRANEGFAHGRNAPLNIAALLALGAGIGTAAIISRFLPDALGPLIGLAVSSICYIALANLASDRLGASFAGENSGAEAVD